MTRVRPAVPTVPTPQKVLCPYCGEVSADPRRCESCRGFFDPLSRQATQNAMGPWFIKDSSEPWRPGCSIETLRELIRRGKVTRDTVLRGPGTKQFWNFAGRTPSIANLLGICHNCRVAVKADDYSCKACGAVFMPDPDRQHMGLAPVHILPGEASPEMVAAASLETPAPVPAGPPAVITLVARPAEGVARPAPAASARPVAVVRNAKPQRSGSGATGWLIGITVVVLIGMGVVVALIAMGKLTIPGLNDEPIKATPAAAPAAPAGGSPHETAPELAAPAKTALSEPIRPAPTGPVPADAAPVGAVAATGEEAKRANTVAAPAEPSNPTPAQVDIRSALLPLLRADPFNLEAIEKKITELKGEHPNLSADLDSWAAAAEARAQQIRLRKLP